jgi:tRNA modification GTPase
LFNALAGRDAAITSDRPGTTRDILELRYNLEGLPVTFLDTAGLQETPDEIEAIGVSRAVARAARADMRLFLRSSDTSASPRESAMWREGDLHVWTKADLGGSGGDLAVSAKRGDGLAELLGRISEELSERVSGGGLVGHLRQRRALEEAREALAAAEDGVGKGPAEEIAEDLRCAYRALERLIGRIGTEDVLDSVFSSFCLGK